MLFKQISIADSSLESIVGNGFIVKVSEILKPVTKHPVATLETTVMVIVVFPVLVNPGIVNKLLVPPVTVTVSVSPVAVLAPLKLYVIL